MRDLPDVAAGLAKVIVRMPQSRSAGPLINVTARSSNSAHTASTSSTKMVNCPTPFCARSKTSPGGALLPSVSHPAVVVAGQPRRRRSVLLRCLPPGGEPHALSAKGYSLRHSPRDLWHTCVAYAANQRTGRTCPGQCGGSAVSPARRGSRSEANQTRESPDRQDHCDHEEESLPPRHLDHPDPIRMTNLAFPAGQVESKYSVITWDARTFAHVSRSMGPKIPRVHRILTVENMT